MVHELAKVAATIARQGAWSGFVYESNRGQVAGIRWSSIQRGFGGACSGMRVEVDVTQEMGKVLDPTNAIRPQKAVEAAWNRK